MTKAYRGRTKLVCETCDKAFTIDDNTVVAAAEIEAFVEAHTYCGGTFQVEIPTSG